MANKTVFRVVSPEKFSSFIKRFSSIEETLLVEVEEGEMKAKSFTPERAVVKFSKFGLNEAFDHLEGDENLYFGIYNIAQFINAFKHFGSEFEMNIIHENLDGKNVATKIIFNSSDGKLKINFDCASYRLFRHISDSLFLDNIAASDDKDSVIEFDNDTFGKITSLCSINSNEKIIKFMGSNDGLNVKGESFDMTLEEGSFNNISLGIYKHHFAIIDKEDSELTIAEDKIICKSKDGNTITVVAETQGDD